MPSTGLNFSALTPDNGAVKDLKSLIFLSVLGADKLSSIFNVMPKQRHGDKIGYVGEFGLVGKDSQGCDITYDKSMLNADEKEWDIREWQVAEEICYKDLEGTLAKLALRTKTSIADLTGTEYLGEIILPRLELAVMKMLMRLAWFGDKNAAVTTSGGVLKDASSVPYFKVTDGLWKRIYAIVAEDSARRTTIAANTQTTKAAQKSAFKATGVATGIMDSLIEDAPLLLRQAEGQVIFITQCFKDALDSDIRKNNKGSELQWSSIFAGIKETEYNGVKVVVLPQWDEIIMGYEGTTAAYNKPYRAVYTVTENLLVGLESEDEMADIQIWFSQDDQKNRILCKDKLGTEIAQDNLIQVAY